MKTSLSLLTLSLYAFCALLFVSCDKSNLKVGDCVQKPDSMIVWKITKHDGKQMTLEQGQNPQMEKTKEVSDSGDGWIKTECL